MDCKRGIKNIAKCGANSPCEDNGLCYNLDGDEHGHLDDDWECEFCEKGYATETECEKHEAECHKNSNSPAAKEAAAALSAKSARARRKQIIKQKRADGKMRPFAHRKDTHYPKSTKTINRDEKINKCPGCHIWDEKEMDQIRKNDKRKDGRLKPAAFQEQLCKKADYIWHNSLKKDERVGQGDCRSGPCKCWCCTKNMAGGGIYNYIINPYTGRKVSVYGNIGKKIIRNYIDQIGSHLSFN